MLKISFIHTNTHTERVRDIRATHQLVIDDALLKTMPDMTSIKRCFSSSTS